MPVKSAPAPTTKAPVAKVELDQPTIKLIHKLCQPIARIAMARREAMESAEKSTGQLYHEFRATVTEHWPKGGEKGSLDEKAARKLAIDILCTVHDLPESAINITGQDKAAWIYPDKYPLDYPKKKLAGKPVPKELAGKPMDYENASDDDKSIAEHPALAGASRAYQMVSGLMKVAYPSDDQANDLVEQVLSDEGCTVTEDHLRKLARGSEREIVKKGTHGGARPAKVWDASSFTSEVKNIAGKAFDGGGILTTYKGKMDLEELSDCFAAIVAELKAEVDKATKAAAKAKAQEAANTDSE